MKGSRTLATLALAAAFAAPSAGEEPPQEPLTGVRGVPTQSGVIDLRIPPEVPPEPLAPAQPVSIHPPLPPPPDSANEVPLAAPRAAAAAEALGPLGPSPAIPDSFEALPDSNTSIPPDTYGAVGPGHLMVTLNTEVRVSDRSGTPLVADRTLNGFWGAVGGGSGTFDPRSFYDPYADRWIVVSCDDARLTTSAILLAVSDGGDPTLTWDSYRVDADSGNTLWADFPSVGFNNKWVVVQVNMFTIAGDSFVRSHIYVFDRAALYLGSAPFTLLQDASGFTDVPALTYDMAQDDLYMVRSWNSGAGALRLSKISGSVGFESRSVVGFPTATPWVFAPAVADHAPQSGSIERIATNDARIQTLVFRNGKLWTTHTVFFTSPEPDRASVQWWQIDPASPDVPLQQGRIDDPTGANFYAFPSIAVNKFDDALIGFSCFAATRFASACYAFRSASDAANTFQDVATLKEGLAPYYKIFSGTVNRWGDFSATVVDPLNDVDLWTIQEYAALPVAPDDRWGTWWGHLALPPDITIDNVSLAEGNSGTTNARFTVSLSFPATQTVEVDWAAADGSATLANSDFQAAGGRLVFAPGVTSLTVDVPVVGDLTAEPDETFSVELTNSLFGVIADTQALGTILNDDTPQISIDDVRVVEGNAGTVGAVFTVTLSVPSTLTVQVPWSTSDGTALFPSDYQSNSDTVVFVPGDTSETLTVQVVGEVLPEVNETFYVDLAAPLNAVLGKSRGVGTILDDDGPADPGVSFLTVVSDGASGLTSGHNRLQWVNPAGGAPTDITIRWNEGLGCSSPTDPAGPSTGVITLAPLPAPGSVQFFDHNDLDLDTSYCYTVWVIHVGPLTSPGASVVGRPFNAMGNVKWKYATATNVTGVAPPTVAREGVFAVDNFGDLHAMRRSDVGGEWPSGPPLWYPTDFGSPSQVRNPIVPLALGSRAFIGTQDGGVHAVETTSGAVAWTTFLTPATSTAAPAGIFSAFGGEHDAILIGTSAADDNLFHALDPATGAPLAAYGFPTDQGIGPIFGGAVVDYTRNPENRVYFASRQGTRPETLWCLELGSAGPVSFSLKWRVDVGNISGSPVLRGDRLYVGTDLGEVLSVRADNGGDIRTLALGDGPVKGFVFPDRASDDVYVSTSTKVWRLTDTTLGWVNPWGAGVGVSLPNPSIPLLWPGTSKLFVGGSDGRLYQIDTPTGAFSSIALDYDPLAFGVGAPSLDIGYGIVHVGSLRGVFYAVQVPLP